MNPFTTLKAVAAPLPRDNIDTDIIYPGIYLRTMKRTGLEDYAFRRLRFDEEGHKNPEFILNRAPYDKAEILIAGKNFGSGSSREHAVWALHDLGLRCIIAESFGDIFHSNSFKNGVLPIALPPEQIDELMKEAEENPDALIEIDLEKQTITRGNKFSFSFDIDPFRKHCLLNGLDEIALTMEKKKAIDSFEANDKQKRPWQY